MSMRLVALLAVFALLASCAKKQTETEKKIAEMEQQLKLAEMEKKLAEAKGQVPPPANIGKTRQGVEEAKKMAAEPPSHTIPAGTPIRIQTTSVIRSDRSPTGSIFAATLAEPIVVNGYTVAGRGADVEGIVANSDPGGRVKGVATIAIGARSVTMADGRRLPLTTRTKTYEAQKSGKKDAMKVGIASGVGAAIGAIAGGGRGAAIGAGAGAAGGTGVVMATRGDPAQIPAESTIELSLAAPVKVQELKK